MINKKGWASVPGDSGHLLHLALSAGSKLWLSMIVVCKYVQITDHRSPWMPHIEATLGCRETFKISAFWMFTKASHDSNAASVEFGMQSSEKDL